MRDRLQRFIASTESIGELKTFGLVFLIVLAGGVLLALPAIRAPLFWDDLHLIRVQSGTELSAGWTGTFDSDHIETPGFRPLTNYFNSLRAAAFGDSTTAHRLFLLILFSAFLTLTGRLARWFFQAGLTQLILGGLLALFHVYSAYHYFWISDGIHLLLGIFILGAVLSLIEAIRSGEPTWLIPSLLCTALALLTREDALVLYPLLVYLGLGYVWIRKDDRAGISRISRGLALFAGGMLILLAAYWYWRGLVVPNAASLTFDPLKLIWAAGLTIQNLGGSPILANPWPAYGTLLLLWFIWLAALVIALFFALKAAGRYAALLWAGAGLIGTLPAMVFARANLLLLPVAFWGVLVAGVLVEMWRSWSRPILRSLAAGMIIFGLAAPALASFAFERELRPNNLNWMCRNANLLYGVMGDATIAPSVRAAVQADLSTYGIDNLTDFEGRFPTLERKAEADGRYGFNAQGLPYIPRFEFLPQYGLHPHCEPPG